MGLIPFYKKVRSKSESTDLEKTGKDVFENQVKKSLIEYFTSVDEYSDVAVHWVTDDDAVKKSSRDIEADYSIDINADGYEVDGIGIASINTSGVMNCILEFYRNSETSDEHDYLMRVNAGGSNSDKFVSSLTDKIKRVFDKAKED